MFLIEIYQQELVQTQMETKQQFLLPSVSLELDIKAFNILAFKMVLVVLLAIALVFMEKLMCLNATHHAQMERALVVEVLIEVVSTRLINLT